jgi:D-alanine-D-alanine ligase
MKKLTIGILFGGKSAEHEISLLSAKSIIDALDKKKYTPVLIAIDKTGKWLFNTESNLLLNSTIKSTDANCAIALIPECGGKVINFSKSTKPNNIQKLDVVFPVLHGTYGEDGTIQGLLKLANVPFVGAGVLGSAVGMDKDVMKRLLRDAKIPIANFLVFKLKDTINYKNIVKKLGLPFFVKPANLGSSVGISKVKNAKEFKQAIAKAFAYDNKIIIEEFIDGREIECSVLGNEDPIASLPGELTVKHDFYSYEAKYLDKNGAITQIPANLPKNITKKIQKLAIQTFKVLECEGLARVDFFLTKKGKVLVNEINTMPGFTTISMYPKMWAESGISYPKLIDKLIALAIQRFNKEQKLKTSR